MSRFKMGSLNHMHLLVPDRYEAADWFRANLGFEIVDETRVWANIEGGPLTISADGGQSGLALFERGAHPEFKVETAVAFRVDPEQFIAFADGLKSSEIRDVAGDPLKIESVVDHDLCYAFYFLDPYGNQFELDCYEHGRVRRDLIEKQDITPVRYW